MIEKSKKRIIHLLTVVVLLFSYSGLWAQAQGCASMPDPVQYTPISATNKLVKEYANVKGVRVTRTLKAGNRPIDNVMYSNQDTAPAENYCGINRQAKYGGKNYPFMDSNKVVEITYEFSKPVVDVEVFLAAFGYSGHKTRVEDQIDDVIFTVNKGTISLNSRSSCTANAVEVVNGNEVRSKKLTTTDAKVGITSTEPFTELTLTYHEPGGGVIGGAGFYVEICLNSIQPLNSSACNPGNIGNKFPTALTATKTLNGVEVERTVSSNSFFSLGSQNYCGSPVNYPADLPLLSPGGARKLTYKFKQPITSAEIFLFAFGDKDKSNANETFDEVQFSINGEGTMTLSQTYNCIPTGTTTNSSTGKVRSADNMAITTDVGIKVSSTKPFTEIVLDDKTLAGRFSGNGYAVAICESSITKANVDNFIVLDAGVSNLTNQTVCQGEAPTYKAKADAGAFASTAKFDYILEAKKSGTTNWVTVETQTNVTPETVHTFTGDVLKTTDYNNAKVRVKYVYKNSLFPSVTGTAHSNEVTLTVKAPTVITTSPQAAAYCVGSTATPLSVVATGEGTLTYKWYSNTVDNTTTGTLIPSATTATFTPPTAASGTTYYYVEVTGSCGQVKSATAKVEVLAKADLINIIAPAYTPITVCANEANTTITANANLRTGVGNRLTYTLQHSATGAPNSFTDHPTQKYTNFIPSADNTKQFVIKNEAASEGYYRVKYTSNGSLCSGGGENYSNVFKFTVTALPEVTAINANPPAFSPGVSTSVSFTIEGTPNAVVTYRIGSGSVQTTTLDATGNSPAIPAGTHTQTVELSVSKITLGGCEQTYTNMKGRAVTTTTQCFGGGQIRPARQFPFPVAQNQNSIAPMNGVNVIREYGGTPNANTSIFYRFCSTQNYPVGYTLVDASSTKVTYVFDKPIKGVEIWLMLMSDSGGGLDRMKLSTNNGNLTFTKVYDCYGNAIVAANGEVSASNNVTDVAVKVTSDKPFTKLTVLHTSASTGALVELCPASVQPVELIDITQHPQSQTTCETLSPTFTSKAVLKNGATGTVKYKWQESTNNGVSWVDAVSAISATSGTIASGGTTSLNLFNITKNTPNKQYRVLYTYELLPGVEVTKASTPATLTVNDKVEITEFKASPNTIVSGVATPVTITIKGTPNAVVTYTIDGGTPETVTLTGGVHTFTRTISQTTDVAITQLEKNCTVNPDLHLKIGESGESCGSLPSPQFGATVTGTNKQMMGSVEVTRTFSGGAPIATTLSYSGICLPYYPIGYAILRKQTSNASKVTYRFSQPVTSAEVWLLVMSNTPLSPGIDKAKISTNCSSAILTKVYDCSNSATLTGNTVASADRVNTDVAIRVESSDTFTELYVEDLWDSSTGNGAGFLVELCPSSVKPVSIDISKHPLSASVCSGQTTLLNAVAVLKGLPANTPMSYQWEQSTNGTTWSNVTGAGASGTTTTGSVTYTVPATLAQTTHYRLKYSYTTSCGAVTVKATTNAAIITINELPKVTKVEATPGYILNGASTPISFTISGTANATVTYTLNGGAPLTAQINGSGVATVPYTTTQDVTLNVTQIEKNACITSITDKSVTVGVSKCAAFPAPQFGASVTGSNKQTMGNVEVTRSFDGGTPAGSPFYGTQCSGQPYSAGYILLRKETSNASKVTYHFSQPVTSAEVWLLLMSNGGIEGVDKAKITTNCGSATLTKIYDCSNTATVSGSEITSTTRIFTDVAIRVESVKPFTELYVEDLWTTGNGRGFMVELCPSSLVVANTTGILSVATQPANVSACQGSTASIVSKANVGTAYLGGTLTYQWEESADNGATWANAIGAGATGTVTPGLDVTYTLSNVASASPNKQYRVKYSYIYNNSFCGEATITSAPATLTVVPKPATPTVQTKTECPATGNFDMATLVTSTVPAGHTLKWYTDDTGNTAANPQVDRNKTAKTTYEKWVALATSQGCESDRVKVTYIVDITTQPTITAPTNNLSINCADSAAAINTAVTAWLNTATATVGCGTPTITNNYNAMKPTDFCSVGEIEVTFTVRDAFGNQNTAKKKITVDRLIANDDAESVSRSTGDDIDVLANDTKNGQPATKDNVKVQIVNANGTGATVTPDGKIRIPGGTLTLGLHNITYKICDKDNPSRCGATATLAVTVTNSTIEAKNDNPAPLTYATSAAYVKNSDNTEHNVLANDKLSGVTPTLSQVTIIPVITASGVSIETTTGKVKVDASTPAGVYNLTYKIKENGTSNESTPAKVTVVVKNALSVTPATLTTPITPSISATTPKVVGDVLDQTTLNGNKPNLSQVAISVTQQANPPVPGDPVPSINTTTGKVEIPSGVKPGPYTIKYEICDTASGVAKSCKEVTLPITVAGGNTIVAQDDDFSAHKVEHSSSEEVVKNGSNPVNVLTNDKLDTRTGLETNVVTITQTSPVSAVNIDTATGQIKVVANTPAGVYEVKYKITEKGQTTTSGEATAKVVVINKVVVNSFTIPTNPSVDSTTPKEIGNVLNQTTINGSTPNISNVTITATPSAPGSPKKPYVDTTTGKVMIPSGVAPGNHTISYTICDKVTPASAETCKTATITVNVAANTITPDDDDYSAYKLEHPTADTFVNDGTDDVNVLSNDKLGSHRGLTTDLVDITPTVTNPNVIIDTNSGKVKVKANTPAGVYTVKYKITEKGQTTASAEKEVKVVVTNKLVNTTANYSGSPSQNATPAIEGDVLDNVRINDATSNPNVSEVTLRVVTPAVGTTKPFLETSGPDAGKIKIPQGTPAGNYEIKYEVCDNATGDAQSCQIATAKIKVSAKPIVANNDTDNDSVEYNANAAQNVKKSGTDLNVLANDKLGTTIGLNNSLVTIETTQSVTDIEIKADGKVEVKAGKNAGVYELKYKIKEVADPANESYEGTVKIVVTNKVVSNDATYTGKPATGTTPREIGNVLDNVRINGATTNPAPNDVTVSVVTPATGTTVPSIITTGTDAGKIVVPQGTPAGDYTIVYKVCDNATGAAQTCKQNTATVKVTGNDIVVNPATKRVPKTGGPVDVLDNVTIGGDPATKDNVDISITDDDGTGATVDPTTGKINVPSGLAPGEHIITYKVCEKGSTTNCQTNTLKVVVPANIVLNPDTDKSVPKTGGTVDVLGNDTVNGTPATKDNVDISIVDHDGTNASIDPATGKIVVPNGVAPGEYTITYKVCEKGQTDNCETGTVKVVVPADLVLTPDNDVTVPKTGGTVDVLGNDTINGTPATKDNVDISIVDPDGTNASIDPATGKIVVPNGVAPGEHTIRYKVCEKGTNRCQEGTVKVVVPADIVLTPDNDVTVPKTGATVDVLGNDTINGTPATKDNVDISIVDNGGIDGVRTDDTGKIVIPDGATPGEHTIRYKVCEKGTNRCQEGTVKVVVPADIVLTPDNDLTVPKTGGTVDVLGNDTINGTPATKDNVDISIVDPDGTNASIDPATGKIVIPDGATPGEHTIRYKVCEKGTNRCQEGTVKVVVAQENIVANADNYEQQWSATETVVKDARNREVNVLTNDQLASNRWLSTILVDIEQVEASSDKVSIDTATGKVKIAAGTPVGNYTLKYTIKPKGQATPVSAPAIVTVVVKNKIEITDDEIPGTPSDSDTPKEIGNVTDNIEINGQKPNPTDVTIQVVTPAESKRPGASVPMIDTTTGKITVGKDVPPGDYTIKVRVCDKATPATCVEEDYKIKVRPNQDLEAVNDKFKIGTTGGTTRSVLENDKWKGEAGKLKTDGSDDDELKVEISDTSGKNQPAPTYIHKGTDGRFTIEPGLAPGKYTYYYTIKSIKTGMTSDAKVVFIVSPNVAAEDTFTVDKPNDGAQDNTSDESVLDNDTLNGQKAKPEDVNITLISVSDSADGKIELDTTTGKIKVKPGAPIGEHTLKYKVCPKGSTTGCQEGEAKVTVQPNLTLKELTLDKPINSALSETHTDSVLNGSTLDGQPISPSDVTMEIVNNGGINDVTINADGQITIPKGAPSGTYTIEYKVKSNAYGVEKIGKVTVTITNDADLEFYNAISTDEGSQNNGFIIKNIDLYPNNNLKIFNRYGVLVYEKDGYTNTDPFKGISTGRATVNKDGKLPQGTYYYVLEYTDGQNQKQQKAGWLYIK